MDARINKKIKILLVEDGSVNCQWAVQHLVELTHPDRADIHVIHILPERKHPLVITLYMGGIREVHPPALTEEEFARITTEEEREGYALLDRTCNLLRENGFASTPALRRGVAIKEIVEFAKEKEIELIVVGTSEQINIRSWQTYHFIRKLMKCSQYPILIINKPWQFESMSPTTLNLSQKEFQT